jgi:nucleoside-diphosphate-sugar epimerase
LTACCPERDILPPPAPDTKFQLPPEAYWASKALAWEVKVKFINEKKPAFDIVTLMSSVVLGKHDLDPSRICEPVTSTFIPLAPLIRVEIPINVTGHTVHVDEVGRGHALALNKKKVPGNTNYLTSSEAPNGILWSDAEELCKEFYPGIVSKKLLPLNGSVPTAISKFDLSKADQVFGKNQKGFKRQLKDTVDQYLAMKGITL